MTGGPTPPGPAPRRIPGEDDLEPLMRCYGYRFTRTGTVKGAEPSGDPSDAAAARRAGWPVREPERWSASEIVERAAAAAAALHEDAVLAAFVAGLGSAPRGRQTVISHGWARFLGTAPRDGDGVPDCGLGPEAEVDVTEQLLRLALGWAWNEIPEHYLPDLEAAVAQGLPRPQEEDRERLLALLDVIRSVPAGTRPGELEKAVARARIVPGTDKYQRYGILIGLAETGVLPCPVLPPMWDRFVPIAERHAASRTLRGAPRSDITLPLAGWRGGLDERRAARLLEA
ncbi:hypothetical protein ABT096_22300 [Streptomyces sp. NPDC002561]|uniref:hypothetical protein n=1 Tax=Streptomyces sp. NPDC002561 TaxID=3154418 RepID=UPI00332C801E